MLRLYFFLILFTCTSNLSFGYLGPGLGLSSLTSVITFIAWILLMIIGFLWYPFKRLLKKKRKEPQKKESNDVKQDD